MMDQVVKKFLPPATWCKNTFEGNKLRTVYSSSLLKFTQALLFKMGSRRLLYNFLPQSYNSLKYWQFFIVMLFIVQSHSSLQL